MSSFTRAELSPSDRKDDLGRPLYNSGPGFAWELGALGSGVFVEVPPNIDSDGPSVPKWLKWLFGWFIDIESMMKSSFVHDQMRRRPDLYTLLESNATFLMCMETEGTRPGLRNCAFLAVCLNRSRK